MSRIIVITLAMLLSLLSACGPKAEPDITIEELQSILDHIATDELKGRYPGTTEDEELATFLVSEMKNAGMEEHTAQRFTFSTGVSFPSDNTIEVGGISQNFEEGAEFHPMSFSENGSKSGELVMITGLPEAANEEFKASIKNKFLVIKEVEPTLSHGMGGNTSDVKGLRSQALAASDLGAGGVVFITASSDGLDHNQLSEGKRLAVSIPAIIISQELADSILGDSWRVFLAGEKEVQTKNTGIDITVDINVVVEESSSFNSLAMLPGSDDSLSGQYVLVGAHHDHLGMGGKGTSSRAPDSLAVHYGADDNASGVAGVLELAESIGSRNPSRSFVFLTFGGEEMGLLGSRHYAENPNIELEQVQAMINLDMIGRLNEDRHIQIGGMGTSPAFRPLIDTINKRYNFNLKYTNAGYGPSDHSSFYAKDIPVLFISTGAHGDYHTPEDRIEKLNFEGLQELLYFVSDIATELANTPNKIEFTEAGPKTGSSSRGRMGGITFGLMPDMTYDGDEGMPVTFVTEGKPAAAAGMRGGDIIKSVDGKKVGNVYDYMDRLGKLKPGQSVIVTVDRDGEEMELLLQL